VSSGRTTSKHQLEGDYMAEGERFENTSAPETIDPDLLSSVQSQSFTDESVPNETPIKHDRAR
jgi:hypothetical protein